MEDIYLNSEIVTQQFIYLYLIQYSNGADILLIINTAKLYSKYNIYNCS